MKTSLGVALLIAGAMVLPAHAAPAGDPARGKAAYKRCAICHSVEPGKRGGLGPSLAGIVGRKAGSATFGYSPAMKAAGFTWTAERLDAFIERPAAVVKGSRMAFPGIANAQERADIISYLAGIR
jgi:cytochrome c